MLFCIIAGVLFTKQVFGLLQTWPKLHFQILANMGGRKKQIDSYQYGSTFPLLLVSVRRWSSVDARRSVQNHAAARRNY